jgi:DoxX-like family
VDRRVVLGLAGFQAADALACAVPNRWIRDDLDRIGFPVRWRPALPAVKGASAAGLVAGLRWPWLGRLTARALVTYFLVALGWHVRIGDRPLRSAPAAVMLGWSLSAGRRY